MFKLFKLRLNKPQKPNIKYKDPANKRVKVVRTRKTKKFELKEWTINIINMHIIC